MSEEEPQSVLEFDVDPGSMDPPEPLPEGTYPAEIVGAQIRTSQRGTQYVETQLRIHPQHFPADYTDGDTENGELLYFRGLRYDPSDRRAMYQFGQTMKKLGVKTGKQTDINDMIGKTCSVVVAHEDDQMNPGLKRAVPRRIEAASSSK